MVNGYELQPAPPDLETCPTCGGPADQGNDREVPPNPYPCSKCAPMSTLSGPEGEEENSPAVDGTTSGDSPDAGDSSEPEPSASVGGETEAPKCPICGGLAEDTPLAESEVVNRARAALEET